MLRATKAVIDALSSLLRAREYADEVGVDPWKFAIEWRLLKARGLEETDARYLIARGLVEMRREISLPTAIERTFIPHEVPRLSSDTAFVLTSAGISFCQSLGDNGAPLSPAVDPHHTQIAPSSSPPAPHFSPSSQAKPNWNPDRRELTYRGQLVKCYRVPSPNQELILSVFQEEDWPEFIDDPLPPLEEGDAPTRLQATVKSLNRRQLNRMIRFRGNGGMKVFWDVVT